MSDQISFRLDEDQVHVWFTHNCKQTDGEELTTMLPNGPQGWTVQSREPLTVTPSIHCNPGGTIGECVHGWIRDGKWVSDERSSEIP
jgi:hypothetical protein